MQQGEIWKSTNSLKMPQYQTIEYIHAYINTELIILSVSCWGILKSGTLEHYNNIF